MRRAFAAVALSLVPGVVAAHSFSSGLTPAGYLVEGALAVLAQPWLILPAAALGVALGLAGRRGLWRALGVLAVALGVGLAVSPYVVAQAIVAPPLGVGIVVAVVAALTPPGRVRAALPGLAALTGLTVGADALEGYYAVDMPPTLLIGILGAALGTVAAVAGLAILTRGRFPLPWVTILWRVAASWVAAIQLLYLALLFAP